MKIFNLLDNPLGITAAAGIMERAVSPQIAEQKTTGLQQFKANIAPFLRRPDSNLAASRHRAEQMRLWPILARNVSQVSRGKRPNSWHAKHGRGNGLGGSEGNDQISAGQHRGLVKFLAIENGAGQSPEMGIIQILLIKAVGLVSGGRAFPVRTARMKISHQRQPHVKAGHPVKRA